MKKLLFSVIAFALITLSCNKYKDDFANLNARIDALAAQVQGVATLQTSITAIQTSLSSLTTAVGSIQTQTAGIAGLTSGLATLTTTVGNIQTALNTLATNVAAGNVTTQGLITTLTNQLATNQTAITNAFAAITALVNGNQTALTTALNSIIASQNALTTALGTLSTESAAIKALVDALTLNLAIANLNIQILLQNSQFYEGSLNIFDEATLAFAETLLNRIALIKGNVTINTTALSAGQKTRLDVVAGKMFSVIGNFDYTGAGTTFTNLSSISGDVSFDVTGNVNVPALTSVGGDYEVIGADINDAALASVLGNVMLDYPNGYSSTSMTTIGGTFDLIVNGTTTTVNFPNLSSTGLFNGGTPSFPLATTVNVGAGDITSLSAPVATTVRLGQVAYTGGLSISAVLATSVDLSAMATSAGAINVTSKAGSTVNLSNYTSVQNVTITGPATQDLPKYTDGVLTSTTIKTITLAKYKALQTFAGLSVLENITLGATEAAITGLATTLKTINATGKVGASTSLALGATYVNVTTITLAGEMTPVNIDLSGADVLNSVTTSGIINVFELGSTDVLTSVSLAHTHKVGGPGSILYIHDNAALTSLTTSTDFASELKIINNALLASIDLSSYVNPILGGGVIVWVYNNNKTTGTYTPAVAGTATTARVNPTLTGTYINTIKGYLNKFAGMGAPITAATVAFILDVWDVKATAGAQSADASMTADAALSACDAYNPCYPANVATSKIDTKLELGFVQ